MIMHPERTNGSTLIKSAEDLMSKVSDEFRSSGESQRLGHRVQAVCILNMEEMLLSLHDSEG